MIKGFVKAEAAITKQEFERRVLIELAANESTPVDVLSCTFGGVSACEREFAVMRATVDLNYTCSVGYDRQEKYFDRLTDSFQTRTVTDWTPFSGSTSGNANAIVRAGQTDVDAAYEEESELRKIVGLTDKDSRNAYESDDAEISAQTENVLKKLCMRNCFSRVSIPGDRHKDIGYNGTIDIQSQSIWKIPEYTVSYTYGGKSYTASCMATSGSKINLTMPSDVVKRENSIVKKYILLLISGGLIWLVDFILYASTSLGIDVLVPLFIVGAVLIGVYTFLYSKAKKQHNSNYREEKLSRLKKILSDKNLSPLTQDESNRVLNPVDSTKK